MTKLELVLKQLEECAKNGDTEEAHARADDALIEYIDDPQIRAAYEKVKRWYA